jgi:hypothetical protein
MSQEEPVCPSILTLPSHHETEEEEEVDVRQSVASEFRTSPLPVSWLTLLSRRKRHLKSSSPVWSRGRTNSCTFTHTDHTARVGNR